MTIIATDGRTMAADGLTTECGVIVALDSVKVERLPDGSLFGAAGDCAGGDALRDWVICGGKGSFPSVEHASGLHLRVDGSIDLYDTTCPSRPLRCPAPMAIGSGMEPALGAMDAGATPRRAVEITIARTPTCGGKITEEALA